MGGPDMGGPDMGGPDMGGQHARVTVVGAFMWLS